MSEVIVKTIFRVTKNKGKSFAQEVYEFEQRISQEHQALRQTAAIALRQLIKMTMKRKK